MFFFIFFIHYYNKSFRASAILAMKVVVNSRRLQLQTLLGGVSAETLDAIKVIPQAVELEGHECKINEMIAKERGFSKNGDHIILIARKKVLARSVCEYIR